MTNPDNQADGFKPDDDEKAKPSTTVDDFKKAAAAIGEHTAKDEWNFWFLLKQAAGRRDWTKFNQILSDNAEKNLSYQSFTAEAFHTCCNLGRLDEAKRMLARGFRLPEDEAEKTIDRLVKYYPESGLPAAAHLVANGYAKGYSALYHLAATGKPQVMETLRLGGCDVLAGASNFYLAFEAGNLAMMEYLYKNGANLYHAANIGLLHKDDKDRTAAKAVFKDLLDIDAQQLQVYYAYVMPGKPSLDELRGIPHGLLEERTSLLALAARVGESGDIIAAALKEKTNFLTAQDLIREDKSGTSPLAILLARGEGQKILDPKLWVNRPHDVEKLGEAFKQLRAGNLVDPATMKASVKQQSLRDKAKTGRWSLQPKKKP